MADHTCSWWTNLKFMADHTCGGKRWWNKNLIWGKKISYASYEVSSSSYESYEEKQLVWIKRGRKSHMSHKRNAEPAMEYKSLKFIDPTDFLHRASRQNLAYEVDFSCEVSAYLYEVIWGFSWISPTCKHINKNLILIKYCFVFIKVSFWKLFEIF